VLLYSIVAMWRWANSYRQMHEFIRIHRQSLNAAFGLRIALCAVLHGLRLILHGVDPGALESAFRRPASTLAEPPATKASAIAGGRQTCAACFDAFRPQAGAYE